MNFRPLCYCKFLSDSTFSLRFCILKILSFQVLRHGNKIFEGGSIRRMKLFRVILLLKLRTALETVFEIRSSIKSKIIFQNRSVLQHLSNPCVLGH